MPRRYRIQLASPPDRERLVAEIFFDNVQWAEINQESGEFEIEFYVRPDGSTWRISYNEAIAALHAAAERLRDRQ